MSKRGEREGVCIPGALPAATALSQAVSQRAGASGHSLEERQTNTTTVIHSCGSKPRRQARYPAGPKERVIDQREVASRIRSCFAVAAERALGTT